MPGAFSAGAILYMTPSLQQAVADWINMMYRFLEKKQRLSRVGNKHSLLHCNLTGYIAFRGKIILHY